MSETDLSRRITSELERCGAIVIRVQSGQFRARGHIVLCAPIGTPDLVCLFPGGTTVWLEIKTEHGVLSAEQVAWQLRVERLGHVVRTIRSVREAIELAQEVLQRRSA